MRCWWLVCRCSLQRLVAALVPVPEDASAPSSPLEVKTEIDDPSAANGKTEDKPRAEKSSAKRAPKVESWSAKGVTAALRDVGLIECSDSELHTRVLRPGDDEVSCELRDLQLQLRDHVRQTNETKRKLRALLQTYVQPFSCVVLSVQATDGLRVSLSLCLVDV